MRLSRSIAAVAVLGAAASVAAAGPAAAAARMPRVPGLQMAKMQAQRTLQRDLMDLRVDAFFVNAMPDVSAADKTALLPTINADVTALTALRTTLSAETTTAGVAADVATLSGYHVSDFVLPQAWLVTAADVLSARATQAAGEEAHLQSAIAAAQTAGKDVTAANAAYTDYVSQLGAATSDAQAVHDSAIALTAGASTNAAAFTSDSAQLSKASGALRVAARDVTAIRRALRR
jgi:hypothetical protein